MFVLADTIANKGTYAAALRAAGAVTGAVEDVVAGEIDSAFCLSGRQATTPIADRADGLLLLQQRRDRGAARDCRLGLARVAIVDIDIHHGNGTQDAFYEDPHVLYVSTHQFPYYPGTGHWREVGTAPAPVLPSTCRCRADAATSSTLGLHRRRRAGATRFSRADPRLGRLRCALGRPDRWGGDAPD